MIQAIYIPCADCGYGRPLGAKCYHGEPPPGRMEIQTGQSGDDFALNQSTMIARFRSDVDSGWPSFFYAVPVLDQFSPDIRETVESMARRELRSVILDHMPTWSRHLARFNESLDTLRRHVIN